jgi:DNA modification methylase
MAAIPDNSIDSIVTDPPYGLSFMGKKWDYDVPSVEIWAECLRVLKPGGHLLAFAGTRTQHRMAVRIEDAGFEIRDMIAWVYSTGFPKSHNFGCKCRGGALPYSHEKAIPGESSSQCEMRILPDADVPQAVDTGKRRGQILQSGLPQQGAPVEARQQFSPAEIWQRQSGMEGRGDFLEEARELQANQICSMPDRVFANGEERRVHHGASSDNGESSKSLFDAAGSGASHQSRPPRQSHRKSGIVPQQLGTQTRGMEENQRCEKCGGLVQWAGWGTALKPALEPITVARKPLIGTVAANVLAHGTGALNVDGCRIPHGREVDLQSIQNCQTQQPGHTVTLNNPGFSTATYKPEGRWPANLIHDCSDEVLGLLNDAARFFYCAKASKKDRDNGLGDSFPEQMPSNAIDRETQRNGSEAASGRGSRSGPRRNHHPTVKPTDLMRYLCRLVTPPGGTVFDPFMGSGSTGKAATLEGFSFIGAEMQKEYFDIAVARIGKKESKQQDLI